MNGIHTMNRVRATRSPALVVALLALAFIVLAFVGGGRVSAQVVLSDVEITDVTTTSFVVIAVASEPVTPSVDVFADAGEATDLSDVVFAEPFPLVAGDPDLVDPLDVAADLAALRAQVRDRALVAIRVSGLAPATSYWFRLTATADGGSVGVAPDTGLLDVRTMTATSFVADAEQLIVTVGAPGSTAGTGQLVTASAPGAAHPVSAVVGDGAPSHQAVINLANLYGADGESWSPSGEETISLRVQPGDGAAPLTGTATVTFAGFGVAPTSPATVGTTNPDGDGDGMDDQWEIDNFGTRDRDGTGDFDVDGLTDREEFERGGDPTRSDVPVLPQSFLPEDGTIVTTLRPEIRTYRRIDDASRVNEYLFELFQGDGNGSLVAETVETIAVPDYVISWTPSFDLAEDTRYVWRVRSAVGGSVGASAWDYGSFFVSTVDDPPAELVVSTPADGATVGTTMPLLEVLGGADPEGLEVAYTAHLFRDAAATESAGQIELVETAPGRRAWQVTGGLVDGGEYFWRARATDPAGNERSSALASFRIDFANRAPPAPALAAPGPLVMTNDVDLAVTNVVDPDGDPLSYRFEIGTDPHFGAPEVSGPIAEDASGTTAWTATGLTDDTEYFWRVLATDGAASSRWVYGAFRLSLVDDAPLALRTENPARGAWVGDAEPELSVHPGRDPEAGALVYRFELFEGDTLGTLLAAGETNEPRWRVPGELAADSFFTWRARTRDAGGNEGPWTAPATFFVSSRVAMPPVADAGADQNAGAGLRTEFDGSASHDPEGGLLDFEWSFLRVPAASGIDAVDLSDPLGVQPAFIPDAAGTFVGVLTVGNGTLRSIDTVHVETVDTDVPPNADAGVYQTAVTGSVVTVDGGGTDDPDTARSRLTFTWRFLLRPAGSALADADLTPATDETVEFTPDVDGLWAIELTVGDGSSSDRATVLVFSAPADVAPNARAGDDLESAVGALTLLDGSASDDPDALPDALTFAWRFLSLPTGSALSDGDLADADTALPSFTPDAPGSYLLELAVSDGVAMDFDAVVVHARENALFVRGDVDTNGALNITDPIRIAQYLFFGGPWISCAVAADANDDASADVSDVIFLLLHLFAGGAPPGAPYPDCGPDATPDPQTCEWNTLCS